LNSIGLFNPPVQRKLMVVATLGPGPGQQVYLHPEPQPGGSGNDIPQAVAVDRSGNIWIAGETDSDDFTLVNPIVSQKVPYRTAGFVIELDPTGQKLIFATYLAGQLRVANSLAPRATFANAIATDAAGNVYVGGSTNEIDFPTTPGAFLSGKGGVDTFGESFFYSFLVKISGSGKLVYSTELGTGTSNCFGGSRCIGHLSTYANVSDLAVDGSGAVTLSGVMGGDYNTPSGYVTRMAADGSKPIWTTAVAGNWAVAGVRMAVDSAGSVNLFGVYALLVPNDPGLQPAFITGATGLFASKLSSDGTTWAYTTDLGLAPDARAAGIALDSSGNAYVAGTSSSPQFPALAGVPAPGADFVLRLDSSGAKAQRLFRFPTGVVTAAPVFEADGRLMLPGAHGALLHLPPAYAFDTPAIVAFANSASFELNTGLYNGALVSLFGFNLASFAQRPLVQIGGLPAPLLYTGANQINLQVPFALSAFSTAGAQFGALSLDLPIGQSLGIFAGALNQDGSINSASNPAAGGSIVTVFGTGATWPSSLQDGSVATAAMELDQSRNQLAAFDTAGTPMEIRYAGVAPGIIYGVFQMNVELPQGFSGAFTVQAMGLSSNPAKIYVR
jgi:uncharacterized protein (TIGR03437 family)